MAIEENHHLQTNGGSEFDLNSHVMTDVVLEVRSGKMRSLEGLSVKTGIYKTLCDSSAPVQVTEMGIDGDEHDYTFHGGRDKAIHAYCSAHYPSWRAEHPSSASRFVPGAFGENIVFAHMNERNVCIGDVITISPPPLSTPSNSSSSSPTPLTLQISLPRQPCFKLNHRFHLKNFAPLTWRSSRTGWYYRVLSPGPLSAGMVARVTERKNPRWTIERVQEYLHRDTKNDEMNERLSKIEEFGEESGAVFRGRAAKARARARRRARVVENGEGEVDDDFYDEDDGLAGGQEKWREFKIVEKTRQTPRIVSFVLQATTKEGPAAAAAAEKKKSLDVGSHVKLKLPNGLVRAYSVVSDAKSSTQDRFEIGVSFDSDSPETSRGGSRYLHEVADAGTTVQVGSRFTSAVPFAPAASHRVFIAGGVGLTAFLPLLEALRSINYSAELHYAVRSGEEEVPFRARLEKLGVVSSSSGESKGEVLQLDGHDRMVRIYDKAQGQRLSIPEIVRTLPWNSQLYVCGPRRMMDEALRSVRAAGIDEREVHFEAFEADVSGEPFEAVVANRRESDRDDGDAETKTKAEAAAVTLSVGPEETLLEALRTRFGDLEVASSCEVGNCGTCKVLVREGRVDHRGTALMEDEKSAGSMLACVSRGIGRIVIEI